MKTYSRLTLLPPLPLPLPPSSGAASGGGPGAQGDPLGGGLRSEAGEVALALRDAHQAVSVSDLLSGSGGGGVVVVDPMGL